MIRAHTNKVHTLRMNNIHRQGEADSPPKRQQRFFHVDHDWFFHTREGVDQGPYKDRMAAKDGLNLFLRRCGIIQVAS